uniref:Uncharacterized protein n=1 Tax=Fagus sylvatica TaxID=28930 RepID=A0A2N9FHP7_FAGSY
MVCASRSAVGTVEIGKCERERPKRAVLCKRDQGNGKRARDIRGEGRYARHGVAEGGSGWPGKSWAREKVNREREREERERRESAHASVARGGSAGVGTVRKRVETMRREQRQ